MNSLYEWECARDQFLMRWIQAYIIYDSPWWNLSRRSYFPPVPSSKILFFCRSINQYRRCHLLWNSAIASNRSLNSIRPSIEMSHDIYFANNFVVFSLIPHWSFIKIRNSNYSIILNLTLYLIKKGKENYLNYTTIQHKKLKKNKYLLIIF